MEFKVWAEETPNPQSMKFRINQSITNESSDFQTADEAGNSPLATKLFGFPWTQAVFVGQDFITITKQDWVDWKILSESLCGLIKEHLDRKEAVIVKMETTPDDSFDSDDVKLIKRVLDREIRPQVALDGGDIVFQKFEDGIVYLHMKGACAGCPSSSQTLKLGIEVRLKEALPSIKEVVAV